MPSPDTSRQRYIDIATKHFAEIGLRGVSLATIARDANVSKQALLHYFPSKKHLYAAVLIDLSDRLLEQVNTARADTAEAHLTDHFLNQMQANFADAQDAKLVMQALLDSDPSAQVWPLKPYLYRLAAILKQSRTWQGASAEDALAAIYQIIAMIQFYAVSAPTLAGMLGEATNNAAQATFETQIRAALERLLS
jgi:AcrR family transcriptional regulator